MWSRQSLSLRAIVIQISSSALPQEYNLQPLSLAQSQSQSQQMARELEAIREENAEIRKEFDELQEHMKTEQLTSFEEKR